MTNDVSSDASEAHAEIARATSTQALEVLRVEWLGRKGRITELMKGLGALSAEQRREQGAALNRLKEDVAHALESRARALSQVELETRLAAERLDMTLPARPRAEGRVHPISQTIDELTAIFGEMGFTVAEGPDIEDDFHNFTALNMPAEHPARQSHDTFYMKARPGESARLLRTHTSPVQIRTMRTTRPPIRIIVPGRTFRCDDDATHSPNFHQVEGLVIDEATHMGHLKGCLIDFVRAFFDVPDLPTRFRPSYFPFTEPSAEMDIGCSRAGGVLKIGGGADWLEILGCGMVHPKVLEHGGIDPTRYQGFAFGMGIERITMLKHGIPDLRTFYDADLRWLRQYGFAALDQPNLTLGWGR